MRKYTVNEKLTGNAALCRKLGELVSCQQLCYVEEPDMRTVALLVAVYTGDNTAVLVRTDNMQRIVCSVEYVKPFLRSIEQVPQNMKDEIDRIKTGNYYGEITEYYRKNHIDYMGLISDGCAKESPYWFYMSDSDVELLVSEFMARAAYGVKYQVVGQDDEPRTIKDIVVDGTHTMFDDYEVTEIKMYLRSMENISDREKTVLEEMDKTSYEYWRYMQSLHIDYNNLIYRGLAIEAPIGMYSDDNLIMCGGHESDR